MYINSNRKSKHKKMSKALTAKKLVTLAAQASVDPLTFMTEQPPEVILKFLDAANKAYHNGEAIVSDSVYDMLMEFVEESAGAGPSGPVVGAPVDVERRVKLPYHMGSMDKMKPDEPDFDRKLRAFLGAARSGSFVVSDKLDGVSALLVSRQGELSLFTRGDGSEGADVSHLLPLIQGVPSKKLPDLAVRGELIVRRADFDRNHADAAANARNLVSGVVNAKTPNTHVAADVHLVAYELIEPWCSEQTEQMRRLALYGFEVVHQETLPNAASVSADALKAVLSRRKATSPYRIDGIIVSYNTVKHRSTVGNPDYAFAFKMNAHEDMVETAVLDVLWNVSKDGFLRPRVALKPVKLPDCTVASATAFNAQYVKDNRLGPGAVVRIVRSGDVIPHIVAVVKPAPVAAMPPEDEVEWVGVHLRLTEQTADQDVQVLTLFCKKIGAKHIDEQTVRKMYDNGVTDIVKLVTLQREDLHGIEGFKERLIERTVSSIGGALDKMTMLDFMTASNAFGHGFANRKLGKILAAYPDIVALLNQSPDQVVSKVAALEGFEQKTAAAFAAGAVKFLDLLHRLPAELQARLMRVTEEATKDGPLQGKRVVFTGFRNAEWEKAIAAQGGTVAGSVSKTTHILVAKSTDSAKAQKAAELGVVVMTPEQFGREFLS